LGVAWAVRPYLRDKNIYLACVHDFMAEFKPNFADDEIVLRELFATLKRGKWLIFLFAVSRCCWRLSTYEVRSGNTPYQ